MTRMKIVFSRSKTCWMCLDGSTAQGRCMLDGMVKYGAREVLEPKYGARGGNSDPEVDKDSNGVLEFDEYLQIC
jgi:hypothetical protein